MSNEENTKLLQRAADLLDEIYSHPSGYDKILEEAVESQDLSKIKHTVSWIEGELARQHFHSSEAAV